MDFAHRSCRRHDGAPENITVPGLRYRKKATITILPSALSLFASVFRPRTGTILLEKKMKFSETIFKIPLLALILTGSLLMANCQPNQNSNDEMTMAALLLAQQEADKSDKSKDLEIVGTYTNNDFGESSFVISNDTFYSFSDYGAGGTYTLNADILEYDNTENILYMQVSEDDQFSPDKFQRIRWTEKSNDVFYTCTEVTGADTLEEAKADETTAEFVDETSACGSFGTWTKLTESK